EVKAHLMTEHRQRAGAGAIALLRAVGENPFQQVVVLAHSCGPQAAKARLGRRSLPPSPLSGECAAGIQYKRQFVGPAALMIGVQRAISLLTKPASACWPRPALSGSTLPSSSSRLRVCSSSSALSSASVSLSSTGWGVSFGAKSAFQAWAWNWGRPGFVAGGHA